LTLALGDVALRAVISILLSLLCGYLLGSVPFGLLAGRLYGVDVREHGSKNIGATNVWRVCGRKYGLPVFFLDAAKGAAAVWIGYGIAMRWGGDVAWCMVVGGMACVLGHSFPVWLNFKGGKGVATSLGAIIGLMWQVSLVVFALWAILFAITRYVSLASIVAAAAFPVVAFCFGARGPVLGFAVVAAALVIIRHKSNIQRLLAGTEKRFGGKKEASS
jgi:acyl phosphate:glycerol-3-phosphate acyltransferase